MRIETQFSIFLVNKPGVLAQVTSALAKAKVNISALTLVDSSEHGVLRIVCADNSEKVRDILSRVHDQFTETEVLAIDLPNRPGAFAASAEKLAAGHININYAYCTGGARGGKTTAVFKVADMKKAFRMLKPSSVCKKDSRSPIKASPRRSVGKGKTR